MFLILPVFKRSFNLIVLFANTFVLCCCSPASCPADEQQTDSQEDTRPNIVLIMGDDMGYSDIGCYGSEVETPNLDRLATNGIRYTQFYNCARCCPTRASLLTGLYSHQAGMGLMTGDRGWPAYRGQLNDRCMTIAEVLRTSGYKTYMSGKWHVARNTSPDGDKSCWPRQRGFDKFYGTIIGAGSFFDPTTLCRENKFITPVNDTAYKPDRYYYTNAISDNAIEFLQQHARDDASNPFFLYVSYTAAHWPLHALEKDIEKYKGRYDGGYQTIREARIAKGIELGVIDDRWDISELELDWDSTKNKAWERRCMEVYAAQIDSMDQGIGRLISQLEKQGALENTLIFYLQDNGGCAETMGRNDNLDAIKDLKFAPMGPDELQTKIWPRMQTRDGRAVKTGPRTMPGAEDTYVAYGKGWANVSNTPFRFYKHFSHEGGISSPLIVHWPKGIQVSNRNQISHAPGHVMDIMATCVDVSRSKYPPNGIDGEILTPLQGMSLAPTFIKPGDEHTKFHGRTLAFEHHGNRALRRGVWKFVARANESDEQWHLFNMKNDRTETRDLATEYPEKVAELRKAWRDWADKVGVQPWPVKKKPADK